MDASQIYAEAQEHYGTIAEGSGGEYGRVIAKAFGYAEDELASIPQDANLGLSCGNPLALARLKEGETVIDLGSGAGLDVFLAANRVGANGKAIGIDMNKKMLEKANRNKEEAKAHNVLFVESAITDIALPDATAHCIISNCVVNLVPESEKQLAFNEMFRLLKLGGRVAISDILAKKELPEDLKNSMVLYMGCVAGASQFRDYERYLREAGFEDILIADSKLDLNVYFASSEETARPSCCGDDADKPCCTGSPSCCNKKQSPVAHDSRPSVSRFDDIDFNKLAGSFKVYAVKR